MNASRPITQFQNETAAGFLAQNTAKPGDLLPFQFRKAHVSQVTTRSRSAGSPRGKTNISKTPQRKQPKSKSFQGLMRKPLVGEILVARVGRIHTDISKLTPARSS